MIRELVVKYRPSSVPLKTGTKYSNSQQIYDSFKDLALEPVEVFRVILLNSKNAMICFEDISRGSLSTSICHPREVFWGAVYHRAAGIICLHAHPSGDPIPSREDKESTQRLQKAGQILGIRMLDHIIIGEEDFYSFADSGLLNEASSE